jgi:hypothetical protein
MAKNKRKRRIRPGELQINGDVITTVHLSPEHARDLAKSLSDALANDMSDEAWAHITIDALKSASFSVPIQTAREILKRAREIARTAESQP